MTIGYFADLKNRELMPVKMMLFLQASGDMALYPFLTLHMKSLGISLVEIGIQFGITPLAVLVATPLIGLLADRIGNFRWMIVVSLLLSALVGQLILYVPKVKQVSVCSVEQQRFRLTCPSSIESENDRDDFFMLQAPSCFESDTFSSSNTSNRISPGGIYNLQFRKCSVVCKNKSLPASLQRAYAASNDNSKVWWDAPSSKSPSYCLQNEEKKLEHCMNPVWENQTLSNSLLTLNVSMNGVQVTIGNRLHSKHSLSSSTNTSTRLTNTISSSPAQVIPASGASPSATSALVVSTTPGASISLIHNEAHTTSHNSNESVATLPLFAEKKDKLSTGEEHKESDLTNDAIDAHSESRNSENILPSTNAMQTSPINLLEGVITSIDRQSNEPADDSIKHYQTIRCNSELREDCHLSCEIDENSQLPGMKQKYVNDTFSHHFTFWSYLTLRILLSMIIATEMSMLKAAILTLVGKHDSEYGFQRVWCSLSVATVPLCTGIMMDRLIASGNEDTFSPCFYVFGLFKVIMALICVFVNLDAKPPSMKVWSKLGSLLQRPEVSLFLFFCGLIGCVWGFIETFITWLLEELHASRTLIGLNMTVAAVVGIPFNLFAGQFEKRFGHVPIIIFGIFVYAIRCTGYSFATQAYQVILFEVLDGITSTLLIVTMTTYASKLSSTDLIATMQAAWAAMHFSVGRSLGSLIGGVLMEKLGVSMTYLSFSIISIVFGSIYIIVYIFYLRDHIQKRVDNEKQGLNSIVNYVKPDSKIAFRTGYEPSNFGLVKGKAATMDHQFALNNNVENLENRNYYPNGPQTRKNSSPYSAY